MLTIVQDGASGGTVTVADVNQAVLRITVGAGGAGVASGSAANAAGNGNDTIVEYPLTAPEGAPNTRDKQGGTIAVKAVGGTGAPAENQVASTPSAGGAGGAASSCIGDVTVNGGDGGNQATPYLGAVPATGSFVHLLGGHGGHSQFGSPAYKIKNF